MWDVGVMRRSRNFVASLVVSFVGKRGREREVRSQKSEFRIQESEGERIDKVYDKAHDKV